MRQSTIWIVLLFVVLFIYAIPAAAQNSVCPLRSAGDADCNQKVDLEDFERWRVQFTEKTRSVSVDISADFNQDGRVSVTDYEEWREGYFSQKPTITQITPQPTISGELSCFWCGGACVTYPRGTVVSCGQCPKDQPDCPLNKPQGKECKFVGSTCTLIDSTPSAGQSCTKDADCPQTTMPCQDSTGRGCGKNVCRGGVCVLENNALAPTAVPSGEFSCTSGDQQISGVRLCSDSSYACGPLAPVAGNARYCRESDGTCRFCDLK